MLSTGTRAPYTTIMEDGFLDRAIETLFERLGRMAKVVVYGASARSLVNANTGTDDGLAMRIKGLEAKFPNLIRVPEKLVDNDFVAYSKRKRISVSNWQDLARFDVGYILGWQVFERNMPRGAGVTLAKSAPQLVHLLTNDRVDVILYERWQGIWRAKAAGLRVQVHEPPLAKREMFIYLHKKHADLVAPAARELRRMKADGTYRKIFDSTLRGQLSGD